MRVLCKHAKPVQGSKLEGLGQLFVPGSEIAATNCDTQHLDTENGGTTLGVQRPPLPSGHWR